MKNIPIVLVLLLSVAVQADSPDCFGPGEIKVSWPTANPIWEMCYLAPNNSSAAQGSSLEIRDVHLNGIYAIERAHVPMLFANYTSGTCYRDWKNTNSSFLQADRVENPTRQAYTTCDVSTSETQVVESCPFFNLQGSGNFGNAADCVQGVQVEKYDDRMVLTTNHSAAWYKYSARFTFYLDGSFAPRFGFGNSTGTLSGTTHWHHAYWRINFDIDGSENDNVYSNDDLMTSEFIGHRDEATNQTWTVKDSISGLGFRVEATPEDYLVDVNTPPHNPDNFHNVDVMATKFRLFGSIPEYSDTPGSNSLGVCDMNEGNLVNNESIEDEDVVFWYRTAVNDLANMGLVCKFGGPIIYPVGDWGLSSTGPTVNDASTVVEDSFDNFIDVLANDTDPDVGVNEVTDVGSPTNGSTAFTVAGVTYTPNENYCGDDSFEYTITGGFSATVSVAISCVDDAPQAEPNSATVIEDSTNNVIDVLSNDTDIDGGDKVVTAVSNPTNGSSSYSMSGVSYTPAENYCGYDLFNYTLNGGSNAIVSVSISCVDDSPIAVNDSVIVDENSSNNALDVLANDTDIDAGDKEIIAITSPEHGTSTFGATTILYSPTTDYCGSDTFNYSITGGTSASIVVDIKCAEDLDLIFTNGFEVK